MSHAQQSDSQHLAEFGYKQELHRTLGGFSSFATGFSYISILTGMFQTSYLGFALAGSAFSWTWLVVLSGQFMVALQFAELSAHIRWRAPSTSGRSASPAGPRELRRDRYIVFVPVCVIALPALLALADLGAGLVVLTLSAAVGFGAAIAFGLAAGARRR